MNPHFEITDTTLIHAVLDNAEYGTLAVCANNRPYAVPINFVRVGETLYFHGAQKNKKMQILANNPYASFSVVENYALIDSDFSSTDGLACPATQFFKSVSIDGVIEMVESRAEKAQALEALMQKLQPKGGYKPFSDEVYEKALKSTAVYRLVPESMTCKFKFGQHLSEERFEMIVRHLQDRGTEADLRTVEEMKRHRKL
jgi:nitroimidazol reductase NimA-like FMN-containing flavoprotein (pyridoxamine 5'-phosphate oxidase superfamily)